MTTRRLSARALCLALAIGLAACGHAGGGSPVAATAPSSTGPPTTALAATLAPNQNLTVDDVKRAAPQAPDLPAGYKLSESGGGSQCQKLAQTREEAAAAAQLSSFGLQQCYGKAFSKAVKNSDGDSSNEGSFAAFLFADAAGAAKALPVLGKAMAASFRPSGRAASATPQPIAVSGLGDESLPGLRLPVQGGGQSFDLAIYTWRVRNVVMTLGAGTFLEDMNDQTMLDLAKKIDYRAAG